MASTINAKNTSTGVVITPDASGQLELQTADTTRMTIDVNGNVGINTSSPLARLSVGAGSLTDAQVPVQINAPTGDIYYGANKNGGYGALYGYSTSGSVAVIKTVNAEPITFYTGNTAERMRIDAEGNLLVNKTADNFNAAGAQILPSGRVYAIASGIGPIYVNRLTNDGELVVLAQAGTTEGTISVSGTTVSYNAFAGSHWSQLQDGSKPEILRGTVMESIDELCEWPDEPTSERLCRVKISDTVGSKKVYGVFMDWHNDWTATNDMLVTSLGAFVCRVASDVVVQQGDLLESNGDGTARVQSDDVIRSSTIGKVTSTVKTHEYDDGTYCVPTVLYCG